MKTPLEQHLIEEFVTQFEQCFPGEPLFPVQRFMLEWICKRLASLLMMAVEKTPKPPSVQPCERDGHDYVPYGTATDTLLHLQGVLYCRRCGKNHTP